MKVIPVVRMNDAHDGHYFARAERSAFKLANPHLLLGYQGPDWQPPWVVPFEQRPEKFRKGRLSHTWSMFDYAHKEVRDHKLAIIEEFITRWDNDGICLDFDRSPQFFREDSKSENAQLMTDMIRSVRSVLDDVSEKRERPQYFHVRVVPKIEVCYERGLDVRTWVKEGLVDVITPGCGYMTVTQDLSEWLDLVEGKDCWVFLACNHWRPTEETRAWAKLMYQRGAHGLQLFNYSHLLHGHDADTKPQGNPSGTVWLHELHPDYYRALSEIGDLETCSYKNCRYSLESSSHEQGASEFGLERRRYRGVNEIVLPIKLELGKHCIEFGFADDLEEAKKLGCEPRVTLKMMLYNYTCSDEFDVYINGEFLPAKTRSTRAVFIMANDTWVTYPVPGEMLKQGQNELTVEVKKLNPVMAVTPELRNVEILVDCIYDR
jgi:hypothetical protein